jgi:ketosteroid isomerase-like protein
MDDARSVFDVGKVCGLPSGTRMWFGLSKRAPVASALVVCAVLGAGQAAWSKTQVPLAMRGHVPKEHKKLAREQVEALEEQWKEVQLNADLQGLDKLLSEDYIGISSSGEVMTKAQQMEHMQNRKLVISSVDTSDVKVKLLGPVAIVTSLAQIKGVSDGQPLDGSFRYTRVYQRLPNGTWKITNFEATRIPNHPPRQRPSGQ